MSKIDHKVCEGRPKTTILISIESINSHIPFEKHRSRLSFKSKTSDQNWRYTPKTSKISLIQGSHPKFRNHNYDFMIKNGQILWKFMKILPNIYELLWRFFDNCVQKIMKVYENSKMSSANEDLNHFCNTSKHSAIWIYPFDLLS